MELEERQPNYLDALQDELGIDPKSLEKSPGWAANMAIGKFSYNGLIYKIKNFVYKNGTISGAVVEPLDIEGVKSQRAYYNKGDKQIKMPDATTGSRPFFIPVDKLNAMLTQGFSMPGMDGGMSAAPMLPGGAVPI